MKASRGSRVLSAHAVLLCALAFSGCAGPGAPAVESVGSATQAVSLADATPIADPKSYVGASSVVAADPAIDPIAGAGAQSLPATVIDSQGTEVTITDTSRILALDIYGTLSRTVFELGLGDNVVGRDISSSFAEIADRPLVTEGGHALSAEAILELDPTVILTDTSLGPFDVILQMRDAGIPVVVVDSSRTMANVGSLTREIAAALGVPDAGDALAERLQGEVDDVSAQIEAIAPEAVQDKLRMVFLYVRGQSGVYYMLGEGSGADSLIEGIGGYDVSREIGWSGMRPVNDEGLVAAQPDLVLMMTKGLESIGGVDGLLERFPALASTPAGINRRIVDMPDTQILSFGPRTPTVLESLAVAVYAPESIR